MSEPVSSNPEEGMVEKILSDARSQADRAISSAKRTVEAERRKSEAEAGKVRKEIIDRVMRKADALKSKEIATARIEHQRTLLQSRERAIAGVLEVIKQELDKVSENASEYGKIMRALAGEAVEAIDLPLVVLRVAPDDQVVTGGTFIEDIVNEVKAATGKAVEIRIEADTTLRGGGCVASSEDGRIIFDNTLRRRLERMKPELRSMIVREVLKADG